MNQIQEWLAARERAEKLRPQPLDLGNAEFTILDGGLIAVTTEEKEVLVLNYESGRILREWLNRLYGNGHVASEQQNLDLR